MVASGQRSGVGLEAQGIEKGESFHNRQRLPVAGSHNGKKHGKWKARGSDMSMRSTSTMETNAQLLPVSRNVTKSSKIKKRPDFVSVKKETHGWKKDRSSTPLCLPFELSQGTWAGRKWVHFSACHRDEFRDGVEIANKLKNAAIIWSGNSVMRHYFFRFEARLLNDMSGNSSGTHVIISSDNYDREEEKKTCEKDINVTKGSPGAPLRDDYACAGYCSCRHITRNISNYFVWQNEWCSNKLVNIWNDLITSIPDDQQIFFITNAGLIYAFTEGHESLKRIEREWDCLANFFLSLPARVKVLYRGSTGVMKKREDNYIAAQDGYILALLATLPVEKRPVYLDTRMLTSSRRGFIDDNHFGGTTIDVSIDMLLHLWINWDNLYGENKRGFAYQRSQSSYCANSLKPTMGLTCHAKVNEEF